MTPIPHETPKTLHSALAKLAEVCDLVAYHEWVGRRTKWGTKPGPTTWHWTRKFFEKYSECPADQAIALFEQVGSEDDCTALMWVAVSMDLLL